MMEKREVATNHKITEALFDFGSLAGTPIRRS